MIWIMFVFTNWAWFVLYDMWLHQDREGNILIDRMLDLERGLARHIPFESKVNIFMFAFIRPWEFAWDWYKGDHPSPWKSDFLWDDYLEEDSN